MEQIDIKDISGAIQLTTLINEGCKRKFTLMKEDYIMLKFSLENPIYFKLGSYVECNFGLFEVCDLQKPAFNTNTAGYDYELRLDAYYWKWKNKIFKYTPETTGQEASWNLTAPLDVQAGIVLRNLKALGYTYKGQDFVFSIDSTVENKSQLMSYDNINILDACFEMAKKWDCECWVTENIIHFGRCESGDAVDFEIGKNVQEMSQSESRSTYATRIYAFGSTKNIPSDYRPVDETVVVNGVVQKRLMLPEGTPYIDAYPDMTTEEAVEQVVIFDEVYPRRTGIMSDVTTIEVTDKVENEDGTTTEEKWNAYRFRDTGVNFSEKYILPGQELRIRFASGLLNGLEFAVKFNPEGKPEKLEDGGWNPEAQLWEIVRNEDYGRPLPGDVLFPQDGDEYVLSGWDSTKITELGLVGAAEQELKEKTEKYAAKSKIDPSTYGCTMMSNDAYREDGVHNFYGIGQKVNLINKAYFENGRQSRVIGFEFNLDYSFDSPVYTVGETAAYSRIGELEEKVESLTLKGQTYTGDGGSGVYVIGSHDSTPATDHNVYSALRSLIMFMRKDTEERTGFLLSLLGGTVIKKYAKFGDFVTGVSGGYIGEDARAELEALVLRSSLSVPELRFNRQTYFEGYNTISPGGGLKIKSFVANSDGSYTVTPDLEDGVPLGQKPDDILLGFWHDKSVTTGDFIGFRKIQYRITSADYDEKTFVMVPRPGYEFVPHNEMRLGQTGNFTDKERQTYIIIDVRDGNCCITLVDNANTWDPEPAQMKSWFGKKKGMTINGINCDRFSAVLQDIIMTGLIFQIDEITGSTVRVPIDFPSWEPGRKYAYYSRVPHNGSTWLCVNDKGTISEPSENNPDWLVSAAKGDKGDPGLSVIGGGHWESSKTPYEVNTMVTLAGCVFISKVKTSNPPIRIARFRNGSYRRKKDGGYILAGKSADWTVHEDWEMLLDGRELKGESITFLGEFASHPSNPKEGNSYRNTADHCTYIYRNGLWMVMVKDGTDGKDGKGYEWIYTRTNIIGLTPDKPESKQQDDYIPEGWTDDFLGVDADHQVEWACKRVKRDGVWSEWSTPAPVHRWSKDGESNIMADLDNEMVSVALTSTGVTTSAQSWTTHVSMWYGTEKLTLESLTVSTPAGFTASTSKATGAVAISVAAGKSVPEQNTVTITLAAMKNGQLYTRELTFKITGVRGGADGSDAVIYSLVTSVTMVSKNKNGGYSVASVSCRRMKTVGAVTTATTDGELKYSRDGAAEVPIGDGVGVASGNFTSSLKFVFYVNGQAVDVETVPMVVDGSDGKDGESITAAGHWESANTPYAKNSTVSFAGGSYLSKVETSNPPIKIAKFRNGRLRRKRDGGYILAGRSANRTVHADWQEMVAPVGPSASYWLDSPVSVINFTSTGTPSPSGFLVTCKQNVAGNVSTCSTLYLAARKYNGSWLAHVGATLSNQISVPATAGYTQFAVRAYKSASDANAWNNNFVAEKGVGVANDGSIGATGATGAFPRDRGVWASGQTYVWNADYRDKVIYLIGGVYYNFLVKNYGASVTAAPTSVNGDSNWEAMQKFVNIATDTLFADGANVAGFMFKDKVLKSFNDKGETLLINGVTGYFKCKNAEITGTITADKGRIGPFSIASGILSSKILYENETNKYVGFNLSAGQIEFYNERTFANVRIGGNTQFVTIEGIKYDAGIDIQSPNAMIGMHIKTPSIPLFVEGGNIFLHPNNDSYVSLRGIVGNWRNISVKASLNNNDDNVMFINRDNIEVTLPPDVPGHTIYFKRMSGGVRLTGGRILPAPGGQEVSYIDLDFASGFIKCMGNYWVMFYCG
nr:MAG TPA: tail protein [Caudoviricetes sp.]